MIGRFRSKKDLCEYLSQHRKPLHLDCSPYVGQYYLPPGKKLAKDFLKEVFAGRKHLIPKSEVRPIEVPRYDELSVLGLIAS